MNPQPVALDAYLARPGPLDRHLPALLGPRARPVICDIGSCEGEDSIRYSRLFPQGRIFAFEPLPANQAIIRANFAKYGARAELVPVALSNRSGPATFHVSSGRPPELYDGENWNYGNKSSSLLAPAEGGKMHGWIDFPEEITVTCETLDAFCAARGLARIDFIHMDVQGAESLVLEGAETMLPRVGALWLEVALQEVYRGQKLRDDLAAVLRRHGFARALAEHRGAEGDELYLNLRRPRNLLWLAGQRLRRLFGRSARALRVRPSLPSS